MKNKRINIWISEELYQKIKSGAESDHLKVGTYTRQLVHQALNNCINKSKK